MFGVMRLIFEEECGSTSGVVDFFSVARTIPFVAIRVKHQRHDGQSIV